MLGMNGSGSTEESDEEILQRGTADVVVYTTSEAMMWRRCCKYGSYQKGGRRSIGIQCIRRCNLCNLPIQ